MAQCTDCGQDSTYNPKRVSAYNFRYSDTFGGLVSPVAEELKDYERLPYIFGILPVIPFFDDSDATLRVLRMLASLSPTRGACIESMGDYVLGAGIKATRYRKPGVSVVGVERLPEQEEAAVFSFIESWFTGSSMHYMQEQISNVYENLATYGNAGLMITMTAAGGARAVTYTAVDAEKFRYLAPMYEYTNRKVVAISQLWTSDYITRYPPKMVSVYPELDTFEDGTVQTFIHLKNKKANRDWYGLPQAYPSLYYQFIEYQLGDYTTKGYGQDWTGKVMIETAGDVAEPGMDEDEIKAFRDSLQETFTRSGKSKRIIHRHRLSSDEKTMIHEFKDDTSHEFHTGMAEIAERQIIKAHNWHPELLGTPTPGRLGNATFQEVYMIKKRTVINPLQDWVMQPFNQLFELAKGWLGSSIEATISLDDLFVFEQEQQVNAANQDRQ
jgi:hypothetical protein